MTAATIQRLRRLSRRRSSRSEEGAYLIDGPLLVGEALAAGVELLAVAAEPAADPRLLADLAAVGVEVTPVADGALRKALDLGAPQAVVAIARQRAGDLGSIIAAAATRGRPVLALVALQDPGNAGTLVRVAEAAGCAGVVLTDHSVDLWNPKVVRATAGALFRMDAAVAVDPDALLSEAATAGMPSWATVARGGAAPEDVALDRACLLLVGSEAAGLPDDVVAAASGHITVPMEGGVESLNAAVAGSVLAFEAARQRRAVERGSTR